MPQEQASEFNRYVHLAHGVNQHIGPFLALIQEHVAQVNLRYAMLWVFLRWQHQADRLAGYILLETNEPIGESEVRNTQRQSARGDDRA